MGMKNIGGTKTTLMLNYGMDSNNGYRIQEQLEWLDSVLLVTT